MKHKITVFPSDNHLVVQSPSSTSAVKSKVTINDMAGNELFEIEYTNDGSEYKISVNGIISQLKQKMKFLRKLK